MSGTSPRVRPDRPPAGAPGQPDRRRRPGPRPSPGQPASPRPVCRSSSSAAPANGPQTWIDNEHRTCVREVLDHLAAQGARRIALVAGKTTEYYTRACVAAYRDWCHEQRRSTRVRSSAGPDRPDAVYGIHEPVGHALLAAAGLRVPGDLMIACFGEDPYYTATRPHVTTVSHVPSIGGRAAVESLIALVETGTRLPPTLNPARLYVRASTLRQ